MPKRIDLGRCKICNKRLRNNGDYCSICGRAVSEVRIRLRKKGIIDEKIILEQAIILIDKRSSRIANNIYPNNRVGRLPGHIKYVTKDEHLGVKDVGLLSSDTNVPI